MRVSCIQHISTARLPGTRGNMLCSSTLISVRTLNVASLTGYRGRRSASVGGSGFSEIWMLAKGER